MINKYSRFVALSNLCEAVITHISEVGDASDELKSFISRFEALRDEVVPVHVEKLQIAVNDKANAELSQVILHDIFLPLYEEFEKLTREIINEQD